MAKTKSGYAPSRKPMFDIIRYPEQEPVKPEKVKPKKFDPKENNKGYKLRTPSGEVIRALAGASVPADRNRMFDTSRKKK